MNPDDSNALIGQQIGKYEILEKIGQGGMAEVYKGLHPALHRYVAIKLLEHALRIDPAINQRFQREAQAVAALRHPNIVQIFDFGTYEHGHYMVMEYVEGTDLRREIDHRRQEERPFTREEILSLGRQVADALDYAHGQGIVHRDVKPGNILLNREGEAILSDFGLAMLQNRISQATLGESFGTPEYIAPEQAMDSRAATPRSDIYSLGGILYEMITGALPFEAESALSLALKHVSEEPTPLRDHVPDLPTGVEAVVLKALAKEPQVRFPTARALVDALEQEWETRDKTTLVTSPAAKPTSLPVPEAKATSSVEAKPTPATEVEDETTTPPQAPPPRPAPRPLPEPPVVERTSSERHTRRYWPLAIAILILLVVVGSVWALSRPGAPLNALIFEPTFTPTTTETMTPQPTETLAVASALTPTATSPATPTPTPTPFPSLTPTPTPRPTSTTSPTPTSTPSPTATPTPTLAPGEVVTRALDEMALHHVPAGPFPMGAPEEDEEARSDERPQHTVVLSPYWMDETEVTTDQYKLCVEAGACEEPYTRSAYDDPARGDHPMTFISWEQAAEYCAWVAEETGWDARLPTEAEWEKAASWDPALESKRLYPWGDELDLERAQLGSRTAPAGSHAAGQSAYGIRDLAGNVWEWVSDWYADDAYEAREGIADPAGPESGRYRVMRGGSYGSMGNFDRQLRTTHREVGSPESTAERPAKSADLGFRCVVGGERLSPEAP